MNRRSLCNDLIATMTIKNCIVHALVYAYQIIFPQRANPGQCHSTSPFQSMGFSPVDASGGFKVMAKQQATLSEASQYHNIFACIYVYIYIHILIYTITIIISRLISSIRMEIIMAITWQYNNDHKSDNDNDDDNDYNYDKECICICICVYVYMCICVYVCSCICVYVYTKISPYEPGISFNLFESSFRAGLQSQGSFVGTL